MNQTAIDVALVRRLMQDSQVSIGITAYNQADGVMPTLRSIWEGLGSLGLTETALILSESFETPTLSSADFAREWAVAVGANLEVDSSGKRRSLKEALNVIFEKAKSDVLILAV